jgi:hypothetical protein
MLCKYCESLDLDAASDLEVGALHHESYADLVASAKDGCDLCIQIAEEEEEQISREDPDDMYVGRVMCFYDPFGPGLYWQILGGSGLIRLHICAAKGKLKQQSQ